MDSLSLTSLAISSVSLASNVLRPQVLKRLGSEPDTALQVLRTCMLPKLDIVCIPDLGEHPLEEWTKHEGTKKVNWLTDLLPRSFPEARVLLYAFNPRTRTPEGFTRQTIYAQAYELLIHLWTRRRGIAERRPIVFLVHNSGALIARSALIQSSAAVTDRDAYLRSIYLSTGTIFILDAPKKYEELSQSWQDILDKAMDKMPHPVVKTPSSNAQSTEWFEWQQDRYRAIASTIVTTTVAVKTGSMPQNEIANRLLAAAAAYKNMKLLGDNAVVKQLWRESPDLMQYTSTENSTYQQMIKFLKDSVEVGKSATRAKWDLDSLRRLSSAPKNQEWVEEAEKEYNRQLEKTIQQTAQWRAEFEAESDSESKSHRNITEQETEQELHQTKLSPTSVPLIRQHRTTSSTDIPKTSNPTQLATLIRVMRRVEETYGFLHARTLECLNDIVTQHTERETLDTAESIMQRLLISWDYIFGMRNTKVLYAIQQIAAIKTKQHRYADSSFYFSKAIDLRVSLLRDLTGTIAEGEVVAQSKGDTEKVQRLRSQLEKDREAMVKCQIDLAVTYDMQDRFYEAEALYSQILHSRNEVTDECRLLGLENQALHWRKKGNLIEAAATYESILTTYDKKKPQVSRRQRKVIEGKLKEVKNVLQQKRHSSSYF